MQHWYRGGWMVNVMYRLKVEQSKVLNRDFRWFITLQFELWVVVSVRLAITVRVEFIADQFELSTLQFELVIVQVESIALWHIFLNNWKWWKRCVSVVYCGRVDGEKSEAIQWFWKVVLKALEDERGTIISLHIERKRWSRALAKAMEWKERNKIFG